MGLGQTLHWSHVWAPDGVGKHRGQIGRGSRGITLILHDQNGHINSCMVNRLSHKFCDTIFSLLVCDTSDLRACHCYCCTDICPANRWSIWLTIVPATTVAIRFLYNRVSYFHKVTLYAYILHQSVTNPQPTYISSDIYFRSRFISSRL